ncbi:MAG: hypothetical protein U5L45_01020 [Saprospiraceae bacterium]|nr:hypothetical protein [Saprospiraceae bacterium]
MRSLRSRERSERENQQFSFYVWFQNRCYKCQYDTYLIPHKKAASFRKRNRD